MSIAQAGERRVAVVAVLLGLSLGLIGTRAAVAEGDLRPELLDAVVKVETRIPPDARTAPFLGTERQGSGVVIDGDGLVLTVGYLVMEAMAAEVTGPSGKPVLANIIGFDLDSGLGLLRASEPLGVKPMRLGHSAELAEKQAVLAASATGVRPVTVVSRRVFAGYWEYLLEDAIFTAPPVPEWGGAALIGADGKLLGIGSLQVPSATPDEGSPGNMFVPIDQLKPVLADLLALGRPAGPRRPWLGLNVAPLGDGIIVIRVSSGGPAEKAGLSHGDRVLAVDGEKVSDLADFYRKVWATGPAGTIVPLTVVQDGETVEIKVPSIDRYRYLKLDTSY